MPTLNPYINDIFTINNELVCKRNIPAITAPINKWPMSNATWTSTPTHRQLDMSADNDLNWTFTGAKWTTSRLGVSNGAANISGTTATGQETIANIAPDANYNFSFTCWFKIPTGTNTDYIYRIGTATNGIICWYSSSGGFRYQFVVGGVVAFSFTAGAWGFNQGDWCFICLVVAKEGTNWRYSLYTGDTLRQSILNSQSPSVFVGPLSVNYSSGTKASGAGLEDLRFYNYSLSADQIYEIANFNA